MPALNLEANDFVPSMTVSFNPLSEPKPVSIITPIPTIQPSETKPATTEATGKKKKEKKVTIKEEEKHNEEKKAINHKEIPKSLN